jgi:5'-deoxynucleotidase YfbR-like HD superfamily hydrolase
VTVTQSEIHVNDIFAMSNITRWHHTVTKRRQSVAEHSFNVALLAQRIAAEINMISAHYIWVAIAALVHDLPEVDFGDIPAPTKRFLDDALSADMGIDEALTAMFYLRRKMSPPPIPNPVREIVKIADMLEAWIWYHRNGDQVGRWGCPVILEAMNRDMMKALRGSPKTRASVLGILDEAGVPYDEDAGSRSL